MNNLMKYIEDHSNQTFQEHTFNEVDNIIFTLLAYLPLNNIKETNINKIIEKLPKPTPETRKKIGIYPYQAITILNAIASTKRYKNIKIENYTSIKNTKTQFEATTIRFNKNNCYIAFAGTDNSLNSWKESFKISYQYPIPAQTHAINYLKNTIKPQDKIIYVGGHSKGGNLAMTSVMETNEKIYKKIKKVYNNDGPGFLKEEFDSEKFKKLEAKLENIIPNQSIIGLMLFNKKNYHVVASTKQGPQQHNPITWICENQTLKKSSLSDNKQIKVIIDNWLKTTNKKTRKIIIDAIFKVLSEQNITKLNELTKISPKEIPNIIINSKTITQEEKTKLLETLKTIASIEPKIK